LNPDARPRLNGRRSASNVLSLGRPIRRFRFLGPRNVQYAPKTPLTEGVNPSLYVFGYRPRFGSIEKHWQYIHIVELVLVCVEILDRQMCLSNICIQLRVME